MKAHSFPGVVDSLAPLFDDNTAVVTGVNGIPWWYFYRLEGAHENHQLQSVDPGGRIWNAIGPERAIGCVVYPAAEIAEPGVIRHIEGDRFILGEPDGQPSERADKLCEALKAANPDLGYWMSEYCILQRNEEIRSGGKRDLGMNTALYVARIIHHDLTLAQARSWQWWTAVSQCDFKDGLVYLDDGSKGDTGRMGSRPQS